MEEQRRLSVVAMDEIGDGKTLILKLLLNQ